MIKKIIDVIIPVYNAEKYIGKTIDSILNQTYQNFNIIIVDDASEDDSMKIVHSFDDSRIYVYKNDINRGIAYSRNRAIDMCRNSYIAILDHDDIALPYRLEHEISFLEKNLEVDIVGGHTRRIDKDGNDMNKQWSVYLNPNFIKAYLLLGNTIVNTSVMMRTKFINEHHIRYKENQFGAEDYRFWVECMLAGAKICNLDEVLVYWRNGHNNVTQKMSEQKYEERFRAISDIHIDALERSGFLLEKNEYELLNQVFMEEGCIENDKEMRQLYHTLKKIADQAILMKKDNAKEIVTMCRKRFGEKVGKAFYLWQ